MKLHFALKTKFLHMNSNTLNNLAPCLPLQPRLSSSQTLRTRQFLFAFLSHKLNLSGGLSTWDIILSISSCDQLLLISSSLISSGKPSLILQIWLDAPPISLQNTVKSPDHSTRHRNWLPPLYTLRPLDCKI